MTVNNSYKTSYKVKYSEVDSNYDIRPDYIISHFQDITGVHSEQMGVDGKTLMKNSNAFWVLTRIKLKIEQLPSFDETIEIETWPTTVSGFRFNRDYLIFSNGKRTVMGTSEWGILDSADLKPRKSNTVCYPLDMPHREDRSGAGDYFRIREEVCEDDYHHSYRSSFIDIDTNKHTNNLSYLRMTLNCFTPEEYAALNIHELQINFLAQTYYGDEISVYKKATDEGIYIEGRHDGKSVFNSFITSK